MASWRGELAREMMDSEIGPVRSQLLGRDGEFDGLQERNTEAIDYGELRGCVANCIGGRAFRLFAGFVLNYAHTLQTSMLCFEHVAHVPLCATKRSVGSAEATPHRASAHHAVS